jgi:CheY-like chemotaxis protein
MSGNDIILLVEDDPNDVLLIQRSFHKAGLRNNLKTVRDGEQAIRYLSGQDIYADRDKHPMPFLVLLDLKMPKVSGFDVLEWARRETALKRLLIVVLTSSNVQADVDRAYELGANSYLVKPVEFDEMVHMIQRFEIYWAEINRIPAPPSPGGVLQPQSILG